MAKKVKQIDGKNNKVIYDDKSEGKLDEVKSKRAKDADKSRADKAEKFKNKIKK